MTPRARSLAAPAAEVLAAVGLSTALVAALNEAATTAGLSVVYLPAVLVIAIRRGWAAAVATAVLGVLALNYFFIEPVHRLTIRASGNLVALIVFLGVAVVVGRLAADARARHAEAEIRAREAAARRQEAEMLAEVAALLLSGERLESRLPDIGARLAQALATASVAIHVGSAPPGGDARTMALPSRKLRAWVQLPDDVAVSEEDTRRVLASLAALIDVAVERERIARQAADSETTRRADAAKTAILHAISHDLRSPLTAISTAADALAGPAVEPPDHDDLVAVVREESARLARLVDDVLDLSRIEAGAVHPQLDWCDLRDVAASAAAQVRGADIAIELPELPLVRADHAQMERVLVNLLENARRYSPTGRPVRVTGGVGGGSVTIRVVDEGPGVPVGQRAALFEPFQRGPRARGAAYDAGAGLGLAICKGFVEANGGRIHLQANPSGRGAAFAINLPLVAQPTARA